MDSNLQIDETESLISTAQDSLPERTPLNERKVLYGLVMAFVLAAAMTSWGIWKRNHAMAVLAQTTQQDAAVVVMAGRPAIGAPVDTFMLPGNVTAWSDAPVYARTSGYLTKWYYDIGAHVKAGSLLAVISAPEVDQQVAQAEADLATSQATAGNAFNQAQRYKDLVTADAVSKQDTDMFVTQAASTSSAVKSAQASLARLKQLQSFERIYAPFDGVVTARNIETGQLVTEGSASELFHLQSLGTLRVYTNLPEAYSVGIKPGQKVTLTFGEYAGREFEGTVARTSQVLDPANRTLLVEVGVDNRKGELMPGSLAQVHFQKSAATPSFVLPVSSLIFRNEGMQIATVAHGGVAHMKPVIIGQDNGATVEIVSGIQPEDVVILDPPDSLIEGQRVRVTSQPKKKNQSMAKGGDSPAPSQSDSSKAVARGEK